jgi:hypothetical protein
MKNLRLRYLKSCFRFWFGLIWAASGSILALGMAGAAIRQADFERRATFADAQIVEKGKDETGDGSTRCWLRYVWHDELGSESVGVMTTDWERWRAFADGDLVPVRYLPEEPSRHELLLDEDGASSVGTTLGIVAGVVVGAIGWALVISALRASGRRVALLRTGTRATGTVLSIETVPNVKVNRRHPVYLRVAYKDELGRAHRSDSDWLPPALDGRWQPGDPVRVVYDPFEPARCEVDIFDACGA